MGVPFGDLSGRSWTAFFTINEPEVDCQRPIYFTEVESSSWEGGRRGT
jgi:hypothetical protein